MRITPAGAGKTYQPTVRTVQAWDHPRRCGENEHEASTNPHCVGSPPQVRGKLMEGCFRSFLLRITPAGAGKTLKFCEKFTINQDHPRRCGENDNGDELLGICVGSPPQVRGKPATILSASISLRITPAGAGKTYIFSGFPTVAKDHPRRCGENIPPNLKTHQMAGSPPQVRGKLRRYHKNVKSFGITPAGAGKTMMWRRIFRGE